MDAHELGGPGYQAYEWLREDERVDVGLSDHRRIRAQLIVADDEDTAHRLLNTIRVVA
jgi:hypothetical protein